MAIEKKRGCGYRKVGGLYLVGEGLGISCGRLPYNLHICPVCGEGIRVSRGFRWIDGSKLLEHNCEKGCSCHNYGCVICKSDELGKCLVMSIGKKFYTPEKFIQEAEELGISKRIAGIPRGLEIGKTWVLLTHPEAGMVTVDGKTESCPAIFYAFKPKRIEKILKESQATEEVVNTYKKKGIDVVKVPDNDLDHQGTVYDKEEKENALPGL